MEFRLEEPALASGLSEGDRVRFRMRYGEGDYKIVEMKKRE